MIHAIAVGLAWLIGGIAVLLIGAELWAWANHRHPSEFWQQREREDETWTHAPYRNRYTESALRQIMGREMEVWHD